MENYFEEYDEPSEPNMQQFEPLHWDGLDQWLSEYKEN